jgi:hypothetical protein
MVMQNPVDIEKHGEIIQAAPLPDGVVVVVRDVSSLAGGTGCQYQEVVTIRSGQTEKYSLPPGIGCVSLLSTQDKIYVMCRPGAGKDGGRTLVISGGLAKWYDTFGALGIYEKENSVRYRVPQSNKEYVLFPSPLVHLRKRGEFVVAASNYAAAIIRTNGEEPPQHLEIPRIASIDIAYNGIAAMLLDGDPNGRSTRLNVNGVTITIPLVPGARRIEFIPPDRVIVFCPSCVFLIEKGRLVGKVDGVIWAGHSPEFDSCVLVSTKSNEKGELEYRVFHFPFNGKNLFNMLKWEAVSEQARPDMATRVEEVPSF